MSRASKIVYHPQGDADDFKDVETALDSLDDRVTQNESDISDNADDIATNATAITGKASKTQTWSQGVFVRYPESGQSITLDEYVENARSVTKITAITSTGTLSVSPRINGTTITGGSISVSSTQDDKTYSSNNDLDVGDRLTIVFSSVSSPEDLALTISGEITLA